jgi:hypothetical protein
MCTVPMKPLPMTAVAMSLRRGMAAGDLLRLRNPAATSLYS